MKISKIEIQNFRLLKNCSIDLEYTLSIIVGKNNTGKTSFLLLLERFLVKNRSSFSFEDFNIDVQGLIRESLTVRISEGSYTPFAISMKLYIQYSETDDLSEISDLLNDLEPESNFIILSFEYLLDYESYSRLFDEVIDFRTEPDKFNIVNFLNENIHRFFKKTIKSIHPIDPELSCEVNKDISRIIRFDTISANRDVANDDFNSESKRSTLSRLSGLFYKKAFNNNDRDQELYSALQKMLVETDDAFNTKYDTLFENVYKAFHDFGSQSEISIRSSISQLNLVKDNTIVTYKHGDSTLPEDYNGLGYLNLFTIIFNILIKINEMKSGSGNNTPPASINLLFIEEPEAHTHPQMQYIFIHNIKKMIAESADGIQLQTILSTHSSHIVSQADFNHIKYFSLNDTNSIIVKNLSVLEHEYTKRNYFRFIKQYLTLSRSELFFADKAIFIEGDTERILLPAMMKKVDIENDTVDNYIPLLSQNISIVEVGAYSYIFDKLINFLNVKSLIITDMDSVKKTVANNRSVWKKCPVSEGEKTSNNSLKRFFRKYKISDLKSLSIDQKILKKGTTNYESDSDNGSLNITFQNEENNYHARSFEDAFIHINKEFIRQNKSRFVSLKNSKYISEDTIDAYTIADECIDKKTQFAIDILLCSDDEFSNWAIPEYIKTGLKWIQK